MQFKALEQESDYDGLVSNLIRDYARVSKFHILPEAGGLNDQNPFWTECMDIIMDEVSTYEAELLKKN